MTSSPSSENIQSDLLDADADEEVYNENSEVNLSPRAIRHQRREEILSLESQIQSLQARLASVRGRNEPQQNGNNQETRDVLEIVPIADAISNSTSAEDNSVSSPVDETRRRSFSWSPGQVERMIEKMVSKRLREEHKEVHPL